MIGDHHLKKRYSAIKEKLNKARKPKDEEAPEFKPAPVNWSPIEYQAKIRPGGTNLLNFLREHALKNAPGGSYQANREAIKKYAEIMSKRGTRTVQETNFRENQAKNAMRGSGKEAVIPEFIPTHQRIQEQHTRNLNFQNELKRLRAILDKVKESGGKVDPVSEMKTDTAGHLYNAVKNTPPADSKPAHERLQDLKTTGDQLAGVSATLELGNIKKKFQRILKQGAKTHDSNQGRREQKAEKTPETPKTQASVAGKPKRVIVKEAAKPIEAKVEEKPIVQVKTKEIETPAPRHVDSIETFNLSPEHTKQLEQTSSFDPWEKLGITEKDGRFTIPSRHLGAVSAFTNNKDFFNDAFPYLSETYFKQGQHPSVWYKNFFEGEASTGDVGQFLGTAMNAYPNMFEFEKKPKDPEKKTSKVKPTKKTL